MRRGSLIDWLDSRTGLRAARAHLLDEPLPAGTGWWFVTGSIVMFLLAVQLVTGVVLAMYYSPSPESAHASVRFLMDEVAFGRVVRGLHFFGASFIVVAALVHLLRVVATGSYKRPREVTWLTGVVLLLVILAFALTGYLLPWDQKAYWATTVTVNIAQQGPMGEYVAGLLKGGDVLGSLTLLRWYSVHVLLLPAALIVFTVSHLYLMRRHGISGPVKPSPGPSHPFYPFHALKDTLAIAVVFAGLVTLAVSVPAPLDPIADPSDASYVPRPEWYFLSLFQLLKYFPGPLEPIATMVVPGAVVAFLLLLPFLDRGPERRLRRRPMVAAVFAILGVGVISLTVLGLKDSPSREPTSWGPLAIAGREFVRDERCITCHRDGGVANALSGARLRRDSAWTLAHVRDPETIAPGLRTPPAGGMTEAQARSVMSFMQRSANREAPPTVSPEMQLVALTFGRSCGTCHMIDGEGGSTAPDLSREGAARDADWLRRWISDPESVDPFASMPPFGDALKADELNAMVAYLAARK